MRISSFALCTRALRIDSRSLSTYLCRVGLAGIVLTALTAALLGRSAAPGLAFFEWCCYLNLIFLMTLALPRFASAIAEEKEEMTLGLLQLTGIRPLGLLLGKSVSRWLDVGLMLLVQAPVAVLAITLGGVALDQVAAAYTALAAFLFFLANLALLCSVLCRTTAGASALTLFVLFSTLLPNICLPLLRAAARYITSLSPLHLAGEWWMNHISLASPFIRLSDILSVGGGGDAPLDYVAPQITAGIVLFIMARLAFGLLAKRAFVIRAAAAPRSPSQPRQRPRPPTDQFPNGQPIRWKSFQFVTLGKRGMIIRSVALSGMWFVLLMLAGYAGMDGFVGFGVGITLICFYADLHFQAGRVLQREWQDNTLSSLAALPKPLNETVQHLMSGCSRTFAIYPAVSLLVWLIADFETWPAAFVTIGIFSIYGVYAWLLTVWLSLHVRQGAIGLSIAIQVVTLIVTLPTGFLLGMLFIIVYPVFTVILNQAICKRCRALAAQ